MARRLVVPRTVRSEVWNYFGFEADESGIILDTYRRYVWCRLCDSQLPFSGNTTNLSVHIARCRKTLRVLGEQSQPSPVTGGTQNESFNEEIPRQNEDPKQSTNKMRFAPVIHQRVSDLRNNEHEPPDGGETVVQEHGSSCVTSEDKQQYCLKWKFHQKNQQTMFEKLLQNESFCDVTIACEEKVLRAHKLVLSACSSYFETVLSLYEHQNPIIILKDVTFDDMSALIRFMYLGEITVEQGKLQSLIETAEFLKIKGLSDICGNFLNEDDKENSSGESLHTETVQSNDFSFAPSRTGRARRKTASVSVDDVSKVKIPRRTVDVESAQDVTRAGSQSLPSHHDNNKNKGDYLEGVIRFPDFLKQHGTYQEFWTKPWVIRALKAVSNREITLRKCSDLLGVGYNILYSRYRQLHGCLKEGSTEAQGTSSYDLKIITSPHENEQGGQIVLRGDELSVAAAISVANQKDSCSDQEGVTHPILKVKLEPLCSLSENYGQEAMEVEGKILQDSEET